MNQQVSHFKKILVWGVIASLVFNLVALLLFFYFIESIAVTAFAMTGLFLLIFLFVIQPLRDQLLSFITEKIVYSSQLQILKIEEKASAIDDLPSGIQFLKFLAAAWQLPRIRVVFYAPTPQLMFITANGKRQRNVKLHRPENKELLNYLKSFPRTQNTYAFPSGVRNYLYSRKVRCVVPVVFRDSVFGFIGLPIVLDEPAMETTDIAAQRIAIVLENEKLKSHMPRSALLSREFYLAKRVESFLSKDETIECNGYQIHKIENSWRKKYFAVIFEVSQPVLEKNNLQDKPTFVLLIRLASSSIRSNALQLFAVQGFFLALAAGTPSTELLADQLHLALSQLESGKIMLDGFILGVRHERIMVVHFGSQLAFKVDGEWRWLDDTPTLGSPDFSLHSQDIGQPEVTHFSIREYPLLNLQRTKEDNT